MIIKKYIKYLCYFTIIFAAIMNFLLPILHIPNIIKGGLAIVDFALLIYVILNIKELLKIKFVNRLLIAIMLLALVAIIGLIINSYSLVLFILGVRNTFRFFIFFFAICLILQKEDIHKIIKIENALFIINIIIALFEFFILKYKGDFLSGTFAYGVKGGNSGLIALFTIELCIICNKFLSNEIKTSKFIILLLLILGVSALAELKLVFVLFVMNIVLAIILNKKSTKTYYIIGAGAISLIIGLISLFFFFPEWKDKFSLSEIYNNLFGSEFGYSTKYDISRGRAFNQIDEMFYKDEPIKKSFGFGLGNCESSKSLNIVSSFHDKYGELLHYDWFTHSMIYLEMGLIGFIIYFLFFIINSINCFQIIRSSKEDENNKTLLYSTFCFSLFSIISIFYDSFLRINYVYFASAFMTLPYIYYNNKMTNIKSVRKPSKKKIIGIMSMQRIVNYGSLLQAYGLKKTIESLGYETEFVDYHIGEPLINNSNYKKVLMDKMKNLLSLIKYIKRKIFNTKLQTIYSESILNFLGVSDERNYPYNNINELVIGSDEVFNCMQGYPVCYSKELFGDNYDIPVISYAACFGNTNISDLKKYNVDKEIGSLLERFKAISVRDDNSYNIVKTLTKKEASINFDPVLIYNFQNDIIDNVKIDNYILLYAYASRLTVDEQKFIKDFAKSNNKKIVSIGSYQEISDYNLVVNPFEVFAYFKKASFIITDTFHGSIFSIKSHSNFCTIIRNGHFGNSNKLYDLLNRLKRTDRIIHNIEDISNLYNERINYKETDKIIKNERIKAIHYLKGNLL